MFRSQAALTTAKPVGDSQWLSTPIAQPRPLFSRAYYVPSPAAKPSGRPWWTAESTAAQPCGFSDLAAKEALASTAQPLLPADTPEAVRSDIEALLADHGRAIHFKRALHEAFDFGFALLDALDLPPLALDVIDDAIATLDALDAPDEDLEPWLAGVCDLSFVPGCSRARRRERLGGRRGHRA